MFTCQTKGPSTPIRALCPFTRKSGAQMGPDCVPSLTGSRGDDLFERDHHDFSNAVKLYYYQPAQPMDVSCDRRGSTYRQKTYRGQRSKSAAIPSGMEMDRRRKTFLARKRKK